MASDENDIVSCFKNNFFDHYTNLCRYVSRFVKDRNTAEDIVQDVFTTVWAKRNDIDFSRPLKPLLYKYARNKALDCLKSKSMKVVTPQADPTLQSLDRYVTRLIINQLDEELDFRELDREILSCIDRLPEKCRTIYNLSRRENLKNREIAEQLGISVKTVERQIAKALSEIKNHLVNTGLLPALILTVLLLKK